MQNSVIIVGAGLIGAVVAYRLATSGARVTVVDAGQAGATPASFGWINASFFLNEDHYRLRAEGIAAWHRLEDELDLPITWCGSLCWEDGRLETRQDGLRALGYDASLVDADHFSKLEPHVGTPPAVSLHLPQEGVADPSGLVAVLLTAAQAAGARLMRGVAVTGFEMKGDRVVGVQTEAGILRGDQVLLAAGVGCKPLMGMLGQDLPMLHRPALVIKTAPINPVLKHILVGEMGEVRQLPCGALVMPVVPGHQGDESESVGDLEAEAEAALARLQALVPGVRLTLAETMLSERPMPGDGLPAVGPVTDGAYLAVMHSGITLGAVMGELIGGELLEGETNHSRAWLAPYRPGRFFDGNSTKRQKHLSRP